MSHPDLSIGDEVACPPDPCPCDGAWANHGEYVSCVAHHTIELVQAGELSHQLRASIVSAAPPRRPLRPIGIRYTTWFTESVK